jgi:DNA repair exonuclease SbcCD ATPase subunit
MVNQIKRDDMYDKLGNIDQIRDIIFGAQLREYNSRFEKIEADIVATQDELRDRIGEVKTALTTEMRVAIESLEKKIKTLQTSSDEERQDLRQQVDRTYRKTTANFEKLSADLDENTTSIREELNEAKEKLQEDVRSLRTYIQEELDRRLSALGNIKVSRDDMAEILFELGMRLKGTEFVPELEEASDLILVDRMSTE